MAFTATATKAIPASVAVLLLLIGPGARAQQPSQDQIAAIRASCRSDFMANCSGVTPGGKDALECLKRNLAKLSGIVPNGGERDHAGPRGTRDSNGRARRHPPRRPRCTAGIVEREAGRRPPTADTPYRRPNSRPRPPPQLHPRPPTATAAPPPAAPAVPPIVLRPLPPQRALRIVPHLRGRRSKLLRRAAAGRPAVLACLAVQAASVARYVKKRWRSAGHHGKARRRGAMAANPPYRPAARLRSAALTRQPATAARRRRREQPRRSRRAL